MEAVKASKQTCGCSKTDSSSASDGAGALRDGCQTPGKDAEVSAELTPRYVVGKIQSPAGIVPMISTDLGYWDHLGTVRARCGIRRDRYRVDPGLYAVGNPNERSDVIVTANYKLTFDVVRKNLAGLSVWLLVLDSKGINVWCAAGKGTFGTKELVRRIRLTSLDKIVIHRRLILPQLSATGIAAHLVKKASGFTVLFGPIMASDIQSFLRGSYKATGEMRQVRFNWIDRLLVTPNDFVYGLRYLIAAVFVFTLLSGFDRTGISFQKGIAQAAVAATNIGAGYIAGIVLTPLLLPYIPFRMFAFKGYVLGLALALLLAMNNLLGVNIIEVIAWFFLIPAVASFMAMNFTGSSTFTSLSGVRKEMRLAVPVQIVSVVIATILMIVNNVL